MSSRERKYCSGECPNQRLRVISGEKNNHIRPIPTHLQAEQSRNAMMSSISPSEEQTGSKAKKSWNICTMSARGHYKLKVYLPVMTIRR